MFTNQFDFLKNEWTDIFDIIIDIEKNLYVSPNISLIKLRQLEEIVMKHIIKYKKLPINFEELGLKKTIDILVTQGTIPKNFFELLNEIRLLGNKAAHDNYSDLSKANQLLESVIELIAWFVSYYSNNDYSSSIKHMDIKYKVIFQDYLLQANSKQINKKAQNHNTDTYVSVNDPFSLDGFDFQDTGKEANVNIFKKDVFENDNEFKNRIESYGSLDVGLATIDVSKFETNPDTILFDVLFNTNLSFETFLFDIFYANSIELLPLIKDKSIVKCKLLGNLIVSDGKAKLNRKRLFVEIENQRIPVYPIYLKKYEDEDISVFKKRIQSIPVVEVGRVRLIRDEYDQELNIFPVEMAYYKCANSLDTLKLGWISIERHQARELYNQGIFSLKATFNINNDTVIMDKLIINTKNMEEMTSFEVLSYEDLPNLDPYCLSLLTINRNKAYEILKISASQGSWVAKHLLGGIDGYPIIYKDFHYKKISYSKEMIQSIKAAANHGDINLQNKFGEIYLEGLGIKKDYAIAVEYFKKAASSGSPIAQTNLGYMYIEGLGLEENHAKAFSYFQKAANQEYPDALTWLGVMYLSGIQVDLDYQKALEYFQKAADQEDLVSQNLIGHMFEEGLGVSVDYQEALKWYKLAADQENEDAQFALGCMFKNGLGVPVNYQEALKWYKLAADQEYEDAQFALGYMFEKGLGVPVNYQEALKWYKLAADQEYEEAQLALERMLEEGLGVPGNIPEIIKY